MSRIMPQLATGLVLAIVAAVLGVFGERYRAGDEAKTRYLDYRAEEQPVFLPSDLPGKKLEVTLDGERVADLSWAIIEVYNRTDRNFAEVPLYIDLIPRQGSTLSIISSYVYGPGNIPEAFQEKVFSPPSGTGPAGTIRVHYLVEAMNRVQWPVFRVSFLLRGETAGVLRGETSGVVVFTKKSGLELRRIDVAREDEGFSVGAAVLAYSVLIVVLSVAGLLVERRMLRKWDQELRGRLTRSLGDDAVKGVLRLGAEVDTSGLAGYFVTTLQRLRWEKVPRLLRAVSPFPRPQGPESPASR